MVTVVNENSKELIRKMKEDIEAYQKGLEEKVFEALSLLERSILDNIRVKSGLKVRTGNLLNSVSATKKVTRDSKGNVVGEIGSQGVPYAAAHEFGAKTAPHVIKPRVKEALKFKGRGGDQFAKVVHHPGSNIPARPFLRPAITENEEKIVKNFGLFIQATFKDWKWPMPSNPPNTTRGKILNNLQRHLRSITTANDYSRSVVTVTDVVKTWEQWSTAETPVILVVDDKIQINYRAGKHTERELFVDLYVIMKESTQADLEEFISDIEICLAGNNTLYFEDTGNVSSYIRIREIITDAQFFSALNESCLARVKISIVYSQCYGTR